MFGFSSEKSNKKVLLSGVQSTGTLHFGNYFGAMKQNIELGNDDAFDSYVFIADYHALTTVKDKIALNRSALEIAAAYIACGLDTNKVTLFRQSAVPEHTELCWIFNNVVTMPWLMRAHAFKAHVAKNNESIKNYLDKSLIVDESDSKFSFTIPVNQSITKINHDGFLVFDPEHDLVNPNIFHNVITGDVGYLEKFNAKANTNFGLTSFSRPEKTILNLVNEINEKINNKIDVGLFDYPVLMAADILMYNADVVPVGQDQKQHIEYARDIAGFYNRAWNVEQFKLPQDLIMKDVAVVPGVDGEKMSKSKGNVISLFGDDSEVKKAVMGIVTDSAAPLEKKNPDINTIYNIHKLFLNKEEIALLRAKFTEGGYGYKQAKEELLATIMKWREGKKEKFDELMSNPEKIKNILDKGGKRARVQAQITMKKVRAQIGLE